MTKHGVKIKICRTPLRPSDLDASGSFTETNLDLETECVARELLLLAKSLEGVDDGDDADDGWTPFAAEDLARYASCGDETSILHVIDKMIHAGLLERMESDLLKATPKLVTAYYVETLALQHGERMSARA